MYRHQITIELSDDAVHRYSIMEWETILLADGIIERDELPLSYGRVAEIMAVVLFKYRYFHGVDTNEWKCTENTTYTNKNGFSTNVKITVPLLAMPDEPNTLQIGIANYRNDRKG